MDACSVYAKGVITILVVALVLVGMAIPLALRKVPRNVLYGFRTPKTMGSDDIWFDANACFGRALIYSSLASIPAIGLLSFLLRPEPDLFFKAGLLILVAPSGIAGIRTWLYVRKLKDSS